MTNSVLVLLRAMDLSSFRVTVPRVGPVIPPMLKSDDEMSTETTRNPCLKPVNIPLFPWRLPRSHNQLRHLSQTSLRTKKP
jgi:hypothetical protein